MHALTALTLAGLLVAPGAAPAGSATVVSTGQKVTLPQHRVPEQPTVFVFLRPSSSLERSFLEGLRKEAGPKVGLREVHLKSGEEPIARQYEIGSTPAALVYDRRGRFVGRSAEADEIAAMVRKAAGVMRIDWAEPGDPRLAEMEKILGRPVNSGIMRTMSLRPDWLRQIHELHSLAHRPDTALDRRTKEMIATYVSALNKCKF